MMLHIRQDLLIQSSISSAVMICFSVLSAVSAQATMMLLTFSLNSTFKICPEALAGLETFTRSFQDLAETASTNIVLPYFCWRKRNSGVNQCCLQKSIIDTNWYLKTNLSLSFFGRDFCIYNCINLAPQSIIETEVLFYERCISTKSVKMSLM